MKRILALAALLPLLALAANEVVNRVDGPWVLYKGTTKVATAPTADACVALAVPLNPPRTTWSCKAITKFATRAIPPTPTPPTCATCPPVDKAKVMVPIVGSAMDLYVSPTGHPSTGEGAYRPQCPTSHMNFDDSILYPNQPGVSHLHTYWGAVNANAGTGGGATGNGSCDRLGTANLSQMWAPTPVQDGRPIKARDQMVYYKSGDIANPATINDVPEGLKFVFGGSMMTYALNPKYISHYAYSCFDPVAGGGIITPGHPNGEWATFPPCAVGNEVWLQIIAPNCMRSLTELDSPDHRAHMAYSANGVCPATHPFPIATITYNIHYPVAAGDDTTKWFMSSDMYYGNNPLGYAGGVTAHADYIGGWIKAHMHDFMDKCVRAKVDCG